MSEKERKKRKLSRLNRHFFPEKQSTIEKTGGEVIYQIYLDSYFVLNFWMNLLVLFLCRILLHKRVQKKRLFAAAFWGTLIQCIILLLPAGGGRIKLILGFGGVMAVVIRILFLPEGIRAYTKIFLALCGSAFFLGGGMKAVRNFFSLAEPSFSGLFFLGLVCVAVFSLVLSEFWAKRGENRVRVRLFFAGGMSFSCLALVDTGNSLREPISGEPVSLIEKNALSGREEGFLSSKFRIVPFHSVGQPAGLIEAYRIERMEVEQDGEWINIREPFIGLVKETISAQKSYQMILHPEVLEKQEE